MSFDLIKSKEEIFKQKSISFQISQAESDQKTTVWPVEARKQAIDDFAENDVDSETTSERKEDLLLVEFFLRKGHYTQAEKIARSVARENKDFDVLAKWAWTLYLLEKDQKAYDIYLEALNHIDLQSSELFEVYKNIGNLAVKFSDFDSAEEFYNKAYTINPESDVLLVNYGTLDIQRSHFERAQQFFERALHYNPYSDKAWVGLALIHSTKSDIPLAMASVLKALDFNPGNRTALGLLIQWGLAEYQSSLVIERICKYMEDCDQDGEMSLLLARLFVETGRLDLARIEVERSYQLLEDPTDAFELRMQLAKEKRYGA